MAKALFRSFHRNAIRTSTGTAIAAQRTGVGQSAAKIRPDATSATRAARDPVGTTSAAAAPAATPEQARSAIGVARSAANAVAGQTPTATSGGHAAAVADAADQSAEGEGGDVAHPPQGPGLDQRDGADAGDDQAGRGAAAVDAAEREQADDQHAGVEQRPVALDQRVLRPGRPEDREPCEQRQPGECTRRDPREPSQQGQADGDQHDRDGDRRDDGPHPPLVDRVPAAAPGEPEPAGHRQDEREQRQDAHGALGHAGQGIASRPGRVDGLSHPQSLRHDAEVRRCAGCCTPTPRTASRAVARCPGRCSRSRGRTPWWPVRIRTTRSCPSRSGALPRGLPRLEPST